MKYTGVAAAVAAAALVLAGCGSSSGSSDAASGSTTASGSTAASSDSGSTGDNAASGDNGSAGSSATGSASETTSDNDEGSASSEGTDGSECTLDDPVKVGVAFTLTGGAAQYGATQKNGVELAAKQLNAEGGVQYDVDIQDTQTKPTQAISIFQKFIGDGVSAIIGPTLSNGAKQTDPVSQEAGVPTLGVSNTAAGITEIGNYIFRDSLTEAAVVPQTIEAANAKYGLKHVVLMYGDDDAFTQADYTSFKDALDDNDIAIDDTLTFSKDDTDFRSLLTEAQKDDPDALVVGALIDAAVPLVTQARQLGIDVPIIGGNGFNSPVLMKDAGDAANGVVVGAAWNSASDNSLSQQFIKDYQDAYDSAPDQFATQAYTGMMIIDQAVRSACSSDRDAIRDALAGIKDMPTPLGDFSFTDGRDADAAAVVQIVQDGEFAVLK